MTSLAVTTVPDIVARMRAISAELPRRDGPLAFNNVYLRVTEHMSERLQSGGFFNDEAFMADLTVRFAGLWLAAYDAVDRKPPAWAPLFDERSRRGVLPIQFALAGMNAHIEHDLPFALISTCTARRRSPASPGVRDDYEQINDLLAEVEAEIRRTFLTDVEQAIDDHLAPVAHLISSWSIDKARDIAWLNTQTLWELRRIGPLYYAYATGLAHTVGMGSRLLLTPVSKDTPNPPRESS